MIVILPSSSSCYTHHTKYMKNVGSQVLIVLAPATHFFAQSLTVLHTYTSGFTLGHSAYSVLKNGQIGIGLENPRLGIVSKLV